MLPLWTTQALFILLFKGPLCRFSPLNAPPLTDHDLPFVRIWVLKLAPENTNLSSNFFRAFRAFLSSPLSPFKKKERKEKWLLPEEIEGAGAFT